MTPRIRPGRPGTSVSFFSRLLLPPAALGAGLALLAKLADGNEPTEVPTLLTRITGGALLSLAVITTVITLARRANQQPAHAYGLTPFADAWRAFASGAAAWLIPATAAFAALALLGAPLTISAPATQTLTTVLLVLTAVLLSEAVPEEIIFRGYLTNVLGERLHSWWIILTQAGMFAGFALALRGWTGTADLSLFIAMGIGLGYLRLITGSVWTAIGFHTAFQTGAQLVLTHNVLDFDGSASTSMVALGAIPFALGITLVALLTPKHPRLFARRPKSRTEASSGAPADS